MAGDRRPSGNSGKKTTLAVIGVDPGRWIKHCRERQRDGHSQAVGDKDKAPQRLRVPVVLSFILPLGTDLAIVFRYLHSNRENRPIILTQG